MVNAELEVKVGGRISEDTPLPYVYVGEIEATPDNTKTSLGRNVTQSFYVFTHSKEQCFEIVAKLEEKLLGPLVIEGFFVIRFEISRIQVEQLESGIIRGIVELTLLIELD